MKRGKMTAAMEAVLEELAKPDGKAHYMGYAGRFNPRAYYFLSGTMKNCTAQIKGLVSRGLAAKVRIDNFGKHCVVITEEGRKALASRERKAK